MNQMQIFQQFPVFMSGMKGKDPNQLIENLLASGQISKEQLEQATNMAKGMESQFSSLKSMFGFK